RWGSAIWPSPRRPNGTESARRGERLGTPHARAGTRDAPRSRAWPGGATRPGVTGAPRSAACAGGRGTDLGRGSSSHTGWPSGLSERGLRGCGGEWLRFGPGGPRTPGLIWVLDPRGVGDVMVDGSFRRERLRPLGLCWASARGAVTAKPAGAGRKGHRVNGGLGRGARTRWRGLVVDQ